MSPVVSQEGELAIAVGVVRLEGVPEELDVFLLLRALEGERQVVAASRGQEMTPNDVGDDLPGIELVRDPAQVDS